MHPCILDLAVIGTPDERWGELVTAVVVLKEGERTSEQEIIEFTKSTWLGIKCREGLFFLKACREMPLVS
ncbi:AMP-binding enzyme [Cytobacillus eiseniae]|nr:hypothetical protein [Cytobacillus eiseniae]